MRKSFLIIVMVMAGILFGGFMEVQAQETPPAAVSTSPTPPPVSPKEFLQVKKDLASEQVMRLEMQLTLIQNQFRERSQDLTAARQSLKALTAQLQAIEKQEKEEKDAKAKGSRKPTSKSEAKPEPQPAVPEKK